MPPGIGLSEFHVLFETAHKHRARRDAKPDVAFALRKQEQMERAPKGPHRIAAPCGHGDMWRESRTTSDMEFDFSNIEGALTPEQAALALASGEGDTGAEPENGGAPEATTEQDDTAATDGDNKATPEAEATGKDADITADNAVVLARDGKHTIPYETLVKHREGEQHWKAQAEAAQQQLAELQRQAQARADAGAAPTKTDNMVATAEAAIEAGTDAGIFGDFSEDALAKGIAKLVEQRVDERVKAALEPLTTKQAKDAAEAHYDAIYTKHPDADSIAQSSEFAAWVDAQPSAVRAAYWGLFDAKTGGTATEIVEVFDAFKAASTPKTTTTAAASKAAASAAVANAKAAPPASLSSIPGARVDGASEIDRAADMSGPDMLAATANMSPAQIEAWLDRQI